MGAEESDDNTTAMTAHLPPRTGDISDCDERLRVKTSDEIFDSEKKYLAQLGLLVEYFVEPLSDGKIIVTSESAAIFCNVAQIKAVSETLLIELQRAGVAEAFGSLCPFLKQYALYASNYQRAMGTLTALSQKEGPFLDFLRRQESRPELQGLKLISLLITPVQRVPRYKMLLERLLKYSDAEGAESGETRKLKDAVRQVADVTDYVNQQVSVYASMHRAVEIQRSLSAAGDGRGIELLKPWRALLKEGVLRKMSSKAGRSSQRAVFLFTDILMYARTERGGSYSHVVLLELRHLYASRGAVAAAATTAAAACGKWTPGSGGGGSSSCGNSSPWWKDSQLRSRVLQISCQEKKIMLVAQRETEAIAWCDAIQNAVSQCRQCVRSHRRVRPSSAHAALASAARCLTGNTTTAAPGSAEVAQEDATHPSAVDDELQDGLLPVDAGTLPFLRAASDQSLMSSVDARDTPESLASTDVVRAAAAGADATPRAAPRRRRQRQDALVASRSSEVVECNLAEIAMAPAVPAACLRNSDGGRSSTPSSSQCEGTCQQTDSVPSRSTDAATDVRDTGTKQPRVSKWRKRCDILVRAGQLLTQVVASPLLPAPQPPVFSPVLGD